MGSTDKFNIIMEIVNRADEMDLLMSNRLSLSMDLEIADATFDLRLDELLNTDKFNFAHDILGIQTHIDRQEMKMNNTFIPRFAGF